MNLGTPKNFPYKRAPFGALPVKTAVSISILVAASIATGCSSAQNGNTDHRANMEASTPKLDSPAIAPLAKFKEPSEVSRWSVINDGVMGGVSQSTLRARPAGAAFYGTVSPENNGGFASIRSSVDAPIAEGLQAVALRVRGDGKRYQFRIRTNTRSDAPSYWRAFETKAGMWQDIVLPLSEFQASFRGRLLSNEAPLTSGAIRQIGFLIADSQYGYFNLEIDSVSIL